MSTYTRFAQDMLIALYQEAELFGSGELRFGDLADRYRLHGKDAWFDMLEEEWRRDGLANVDDVIGPARSTLVEISARGMRRIEEAYGDSDGVGQILERYDSNESSIANIAERFAPLPKDFQLTDSDRDSLVQNLIEITSKLDALDISNAHKAQARALITSAQVLAEAPEPPADLIWDIVARLSNISGIASLVLSIVALFHH